VGESELVCCRWTVRNPHGPFATETTTSLVLILSPHVEHFRYLTRTPGQGILVAITVSR